MEGLLKAQVTEQLICWNRFVWIMFALPIWTGEEKPQQALLNGLQNKIKTEPPKKEEGQGRVSVDVRRFAHTRLKPSALY